MPAVKTKRISTLIETQLPEFIASEYELFSKFVQKYYESQEVQGGTLDIISNIQKYADIDFYEKGILKQNDVLFASIANSDTTIVLEDARSFPEKNGYVRIDNEIIFYATRTDTELRDCSRGVSGNTSLGDLYESSNFISTEAAPHNAGQRVYNVSNLFLYAFVRSFENQYLNSFPEKYLKGDVDKRTLIKNIQKFYKAKGTTSSIKFIFNSIVAEDVNDKPEVYKPKDFTYKSSNADWINVYALKCKVISGNLTDIIGKKISQEETSEYGYASAVVDNVSSDGLRDEEQIVNLVLAPETVNGEFYVSTKTKLIKGLSGVATTGNRIDVFSTLGWNKSGSILIGNEVITYEQKTATQFIIKTRQPSGANTYPTGTSVYKPVIISGSGVSLLVLGVVYNLSPTDGQPYSSVGDKIQVSDPGFFTADPKIVRLGSNQTRWLLSNGSAVNVPTLPAVSSSLDEVPTDVTSIHEDDQYYYITSSSFPSHKILDGSTVNKTVLDQKILRLIRKRAVTSTERYNTPKADTGILLNGVRTYSYRDTESLRFGKLEEIKIDTQGRGYAKPPFVLVDEVPNKARAILSGQVVERIIVDTTDIFPKTPEITITSGRRAEVRAIVTGGKVTSLVIDNPGEYYSSPPLVRIRDNAGRGRFANYEAIINGAGKITGFSKIDEGNFYNQNSVIVDIIAVGEGASGIPLLKEWNFNRYEKLKNTIDTENGYIFQNYDKTLEYGYGYVANPKSLRVALNDNLNSAGSEPVNKVHSPIIGFAYDGNPIYGPFGYENPLDVQSSIVRMTSGYSIKNSRSGGPAVNKYPLGTFIDDYRYVHRSGSLDENNGRFCITPEFPQGTYAYFLTIDSNQTPKFPYIIGANFYSLPVDSNYNSDINQNDIPKNAKRYYVPGISRNGSGLIASISDVSSGTVDNIDIVRSSPNFSVNSKVYFNNQGTEGSEVEANVSSVKGKVVNYLQSKETKVVKLTTIQTAYLFADDTLRQPSSGASGTIVGTVASDNVIVLKDVNGTFDNTGTFSADIKTFSLLLDQDSSYTEGAILSLTNGVDPAIATAEVLEGTNRQNVVKIKVVSGTWIIDEDYFIQSSNLFNTIGSRIVTLTSLSDNLEPFEVNQSVALVETTTDHGLGIGDNVTIDINPDDINKTKTYYLRKRLYQEATLIAPKVNTSINDTGVGRFQVLNGGADYTPGVYTNVPLTGGSGSGATAIITVSDAGSVSNVQIQTKGSGYKKADYLEVDDESLVRSIASLSTMRLVIYVDHVGFAAGSTKLVVHDATKYAEGDLISVGQEVLEISSISGNTLTVLTGREETAVVDHYDGQQVSLYKPRYNFSPNFQIFSGVNSGYIQSYDRESQKIIIVYDYGTLLSNANKVTLSSSFFDSSTPARLVAIRSAGSINYKFEFSQDNVVFTPNPDINIQEFYRYVFDTSHSSLTGTYFDMSPSRNFNLETVEKKASEILPGNPGSFTDVKFGFGARLANNTYQNKVGTSFTNFYYYDRKGIINSDGASLKIITDPLQGVKTLNYVTPRRFVYDVNREPLWDGSGSISYTTTGQFAVGEINGFSITNLGLNYKKVPAISGVDPNQNFRAYATVLFDLATNTITGVRIDEKGSNYVNPKIIITNGNGVDATFKVVVRNGEIFSITIDNPGVGYTFAPEIAIVEGDVEAYAESQTIGVPRSVSITNNGGAFHRDKTVSSTFNSKFVFALSNYTGNFRKGEVVVQRIANVEVARAKVSEWRFGSNLLKVENVEGIFRENETVQSLNTSVSANIKSIFVSTFTEDITGFYDNIGYFKSDRGRLGVSNQKILDSFFYQDYSYVVKSKTPIDQWRELIKSTTHPAGFKLFGQVDVEATAGTEMPAELPKASHFTVIQLWDPEKNKITVENTTRTVTQIVQKVENQRIRKGVGSAATSEFLFNEMRAFEVSLAAPFDGYYDTDGKLQGTTSFQILDDSGLPFNPFSAKNLIISLDGILQEPEVSYTVAGDNIIFSQPPLGPYQKQTGEGQSDITSYKGVTFYGKYVAFKDNQYNTRYFKKIRNIFQRNGRWLDAANQIERNRQFIIEETIGYAKATYPTLDWSTKQDDYELNIGSILDAYEHDLRFGGNIKTVDYTSIFNTDSDYLYIQNNRSQSTGIFNYAARLAKLAIRNWDYTDLSVTYIQGSSIMSVTDTENLAIGMFVSSGRAYPPGTYIVSIDSDTQVTLNHSALSNSSGGGGAPAGTTLLSGTATTGSFATNTGAVAPGDTYSVPPGVTVTAPLSFSGTDQATFSWSGINNGTFYDASNLINANKAYIQEETIGWAKATYPNLNWEDPSSTRQNANISVSTVRSLDIGGIKIIEGDGYVIGYEPTLYAFPGENTVVTPGNQTGFGYSMTPVLNRVGYIKQFLLNGGSGYDPANPPQITFSGDLSGRLSGTPVIQLGQITSIDLWDIENDRPYIIGDRFTEINGIQVEQELFNDEGDSVITIEAPPNAPNIQATVTITIGREIESILVTDPGQGFLPGNEIVYIRGIDNSDSNGFFQIPTTTLDATCFVKRFTTFSINDGGYGYVKNPVPTLSLSGVGQFAPTAKSFTDSEGRITSVRIDNEGSYGYTVNSVSFASDQFAPGGTYDVETKCHRDIGYLIDAYTYHLRFGGNARVVEFGQLYYNKAKYPSAENLLFINNELTESLASYEYAKDLMVLAMRNALGVGNYTSIPPFTDNTILVDSQSPYCAEVESALDTYNGIIDTILSEGKGLVSSTNQNPNKSGNWSQTLTYSNYNIIPDPSKDLSQECSDVISSVDALTSNVNDILSKQSIIKTLPDYIDGETKDFELYWEDGTEVILEEDEDLFLTINAVLQRPKYTETYPLFDAYFIDRNVIPNLIKFDVAPIWDQDFGAKNIGEPTAVEKISGIGVGNYKRLTIDYELVNGVRNGPFLILDVEDNTVQNIESEDNAYVFLDGVLQRKGYSYTISGPNIYFNVPIQKEMKIDIRYLYGRDVGQILNIYDFAPDTYFARGTFLVDGIPQNIINQYSSYSWMADKVGTAVHVWQERPDGTYNVIGELTGLVKSSTSMLFTLKSQNGYVEPGLDLTFAVKGKYSLSYTISTSNYTSAAVTFDVDDDGRKLLSDDNSLWTGTFIGKSHRNPFVYLSNGDKIRVEGEDQFRSIKRLPITTTSKDGRSGEQLSDDIYGAVSIDTYTGITRGEGLSVVAIIQNGSVVSLEWNQRSYDPLTQPTAYQYFTPPVLKFIPKNGNGGGARANVLVSKGQVISVDLIDGGSGYTEAPQVIVSRRYDILSERDIGVSLINIGVNPYIQSGGLSIASTISVLGNQIAGVDTFTSIVFNSPVSSDRVITAEIQLVEQASDQLQSEQEVYSTYSTISDNTQIIDVFPEATVVSAQVQDIVTANSIATVSKQITTVVHNIIQNTSLSNVNYFEVAAFLQVDLDPTDTIVYVANTSKFKNAGFLLIGNEIVAYYKKINDRFLMVQRGENGTIPQFWPAGTYIRQIPETVSIAPGGVTSISSESEVRMVSVSASAGGFERKINRQISSPPVSISPLVVPEVVIMPPNSGAVDYYQESIFVPNPIITRSGSVTISEYTVTQRSGTVIKFKNAIVGIYNPFISQSLIPTKVGPTIGSFDQGFDGGTTGVSEYTIEQMDLYFSSLSIADFIDRHDSSYTKSGDYFSLVNPSIQNPVAITTSSGTIPSTIIVQDTTYFPSSGYLFTSGGSLIQYTGTTSTSFTGCSHVNGPTSISNGQQLVPYSIT